MTTELLLFWLENVWRRRKNSLFRSAALLILDRHASHLHRDVLSAMSQQHQTRALFVPPGMTPILQPCDVSWNKPFKDAMRRKWKTWLVEGEKEYTRAGNRRSASYKQVAEWVEECWKDLDSDIVARSFVHCGIVKVPEEENPVYHHRLQQIILDKNQTKRAVKAQSQKATWNSKL